MSAKSCKHYLHNLRLARECVVASFLTVVAPQKLEARKYDKELARNVEQRWNSHKINVYCLVYERDTFRRAKFEGRPKPQGDDNDFVVFLGPSLEVDFVTVKDPSSEGARLIAQAEAVAAVDCESLSESKLFSFRFQIAEVIVCALRDEEAIGKSLLKEAASGTPSRGLSWKLRVHGDQDWKSEM